MLSGCQVGLRHDALGLGNKWGREGAGLVSTWRDRMDFDTGAQIRFKMGDLPGRGFLDWIGLQNGNGPCTDVKRTA